MEELVLLDFWEIKKKFKDFESSDYIKEISYKDFCLLIEEYNVKSKIEKYNSILNNILTKEISKFKYDDDIFKSLNETNLYYNLFVYLYLIDEENSSIEYSKLASIDRKMSGEEFHFKGSDTYREYRENVVILNDIQTLLDKYIDEKIKNNPSVEGSGFLNLVENSNLELDSLIKEIHKKVNGNESYFHSNLIDFISAKLGAAVMGQEIEVTEIKILASLSKESDQ